MNDRTLTRFSVSNFDNRVQQVLDYERAKQCLDRIGHQIKHLKLKCCENFSHLYQFMMLLTWHLTQVIFYFLLFLFDKLLLSI